MPRRRNRGPNRRYVNGGNTNGPSSKRFRYTSGNAAASKQAAFARRKYMDNAVKPSSPTSRDPISTTPHTRRFHGAPLPFCGPNISDELDCGYFDGNPTYCALFSVGNNPQQGCTWHADWQWCDGYQVINCSNLNQAQCEAAASIGMCNFNPSGYTTR